MMLIMRIGEEVEGHQDDYHKQEYRIWKKGGARLEIGLIWALEAEEKEEEEDYKGI